MFIIYCHLHKRYKYAENAHNFCGKIKNYIQKIKNYIDTESGTNNAPFITKSFITKP